ncbi:MAG: glycosyl hydrolase family 65 protein, partial [candidate division WOR-3 bacterium]
PMGALYIPSDQIKNHAEEVKNFANKLFWNDKTGRFVCGIDVDGKSYDYGFTFVNCEAIYYGFATDEQAKSIMDWISGVRIVDGDTSQGEDIYRWRFGPRATTKRNIDYYGWFWHSPETIPWGGQVQDGGAVLGFSYHDLASRIKVYGADNAEKRLKEITEWFDEVQKAGGYREYYKDGRQGTTLQGGGTAGGLGLDFEFFESILVPQIMLNGFMGFKPRGDGFEIAPNIPQNWQSLEITRIHLHDLILDITATNEMIILKSKGEARLPFFVYLPAGKWNMIQFDVDEKKTNEIILNIEPGKGVSIQPKDEISFSFFRII